MIVAEVKSASGAKYVIQQISKDPLRYVAFSAGPIEAGPLHRDGRTFSEAMACISLCIDNQLLTETALFGGVVRAG